MLRFLSILLLELGMVKPRRRREVRQHPMLAVATLTIPHHLSGAIPLIVRSSLVSVIGQLAPWTPTAY
jgi:hypothetical protein